MLEIGIYTQLDTDWLGRELDEAASDFAACHPVRPSLDDRLDAEDARRLRDKLATRYRDWTGRDLAADLAEQKP